MVHFYWASGGGGREGIHMRDASGDPLNIFLFITAAELKEAHARPACFIKGKEGKVELVVTVLHGSHIRDGASQVVRVARGEALERPAASARIVFVIVFVFV